MPVPRIPTRSISMFILAVLLPLVLASCGGSPGPKPQPGSLRTLTGSITLPSGNSVDLASLTVSTPTGTAAVSASGEFTITVFAGAATEVGVETAAGELLLLGVTDGDSGGDTVSVSLTTTAEALLYYAVGGMWLPADQQDKVRSLLRGAPEAEGLATELERQLMGGGNGAAEPDSGVLAALDAAHAALLEGTPVMATTTSWVSSTASGRGQGGSALLTPYAVDGSNIIIEPSVAQAGVKVVHNPSGAGVVAQNTYRRPAAVLAYEVAWEDADHIEHPVDPPQLIEQVDVPATGQLEFLNALIDVVTGDSPWSPVLSQPLTLVGHEGASRTHYRLVLVGPSATDAAWPIMTDPLFTSFHDDWSGIVTDKSLELFLDDLLMPLMEVYGLGSMAKLDAAKLNKMRARMRYIHDTHLAGLGVYLTQGPRGYANGLKFVLEELAQNRTYRLDMLGMVKDALAESDKNKTAIDAMERRLSSRASASAIAAAVQTALVSGDVAKIMYDLASSPSVVDWTAVSAPSLFALTPAKATVTRNHASAKFTVIPKGVTTGNFLFRWTTSGTHGELDDLLKSGKTVVTSEREVWYFHNNPLGIQDTDRDSVVVEVFEVPTGATSIPVGASPIARMAAEVRGDSRVLDSRLEVRYGATPTGMYIKGHRYGCAEMFLRFKAEPDAKSYTVSFLGVGGQGDERNSNQEFRTRGPNQSVFIDPNARIVGSTVEDGFTPDFYGVCNWHAPDDPVEFAFPPMSLVPLFDRAKNEYVIAMFVVVDYSGLVKDPVPVDSRVPLWYDWVENADFIVEVAR